MGSAETKGWLPVLKKRGFAKTQRVFSAILRQGHRSKYLMPSDRSHAEVLIPVCSEIHTAVIPGRSVHIQTY